MVSSQYMADGTPKAKELIVFATDLLRNIE